MQSPECKAVDKVPVCIGTTEFDLCGEGSIAAKTKSSKASSLTANRIDHSFQSRQLSVAIVVMHISDCERSWICRQC